MPPFKQILPNCYCISALQLNLYKSHKEVVTLWNVYLIYGAATQIMASFVVYVLSPTLYRWFTLGIACGRTCSLLARLGSGRLWWSWRKWRERASRGATQRRPTRPKRSLRTRRESLRLVHTSSCFRLKRSPTFLPCSLKDISSQPPAPLLCSMPQYTHRSASRVWVGTWACSFCKRYQKTYSVVSVPWQFCIITVPQLVAKSVKAVMLKQVYMSLYHCLVSVQESWQRKCSRQLTYC